MDDKSELHEELRKAEIAEIKAWKHLQRTLLEYGKQSEQWAKAISRHSKAQERRIKAIQAIQRS